MRATKVWHANMRTGICIDRGAVVRLFARLLGRLIVVMYARSRLALYVLRAVIFSCVEVAVIRRRLQHRLKSTDTPRVSEELVYFEGEFPRTEQRTIFRRNDARVDLPSEFTSVIHRV